MTNVFISREIMKGRMFRLIHNNKILNTIIITSKVYMMNDFILKKFSIEKLFDKVSMFRNINSIRQSNVNVFSATSNSAFPHTVFSTPVFSFTGFANLISLLVRNYMAFKSIRYFVSSYKRRGNSLVPRWYALMGFRHLFSRLLREASFIPTWSRAKLSSSHVNFGLFKMKVFSANSTDTVFHNNNISLGLSLSTNFDPSGRF